MKIETSPHRPVMLWRTGGKSGYFATACDEEDARLIRDAVNAYEPLKDIIRSIKDSHLDNAMALMHELISEELK